jgi:4-diphosphocytidyl-2-C-methyl-D-erythritol kinase
VVVFPNCKINIGLSIVEKRSDGYHNLESVFYPLALCDALEIIENNNQLDYNFTCNIKSIPTDDSNLVIKALHLVRKYYTFPGVDINLIKNIPYGAGLGGGSSDAAYTIKCLNELFNLGMTNERLIELSSQIGSDCAFFIKNEACFAYERGDKFKASNIDLKEKYILLVKPDYCISTAEAYSNIIPHKIDFDIETVLTSDRNNWKDYVVNDFEKTAFNKFPELQEIKQWMYNKGAFFSAMSGSGSTIYGLFDEKPELNGCWNKHFSWISEL